jgi:hypothetical protein
MVAAGCPHAHFFVTTILIKRRHCEKRQMKVALKLLVIYGKSLENWRDDLPRPREQSAMEAINTGRYWTTADCHVL